MSRFSLRKAYNALWKSRDLMAHRGPGEPYRIALAESIIAPEASVLDVGCGNGAFVEALRMCGHQGDYLGVDIAAPAIQLAQERYPAERFEIIGRRRSIRPPRDWVVCACALEHQWDPRALLRLLFRSCRRGGTVAIVWFLPPTPTGSTPEAPRPIAEPERGIPSITWDETFIHEIIKSVGGCNPRRVKCPLRNYITECWTRT